MTVGIKLKNNIDTIDITLGIAKERLIKAAKEGASGVVVIRIPFRNGGIRDVTFGEEVVIKADTRPSIKKTLQQ